MEMIKKLADRWIESGVEHGDTLLLHSNIKRTLMDCRRAGYSTTPQDIFDSFLLALGDRGTLLLPLFNFDFPKGTPFDIRNTPSQMGVLTEIGRIHPKSVRTGHPIYSFAVIGYNSKECEGIDNKSGYSEESPFGILKQMNGKIASLDLDDQNSMTFYHHVEEIKQVDYRYFKDFSGLYTNWAGAEKMKTYRLFVRNIERGVKTDVNPAGELMWQCGLYKGSRPKEGSGLRVIKSNEMFDFVERLITDGNALGSLYSLEERL